MEGLRPAEKVTARRSECYSGLLFPPERGQTRMVPERAQEKFSKISAMAFLEMPIGIS
jgi:hypothetical protein